jgi:hypothetical protein
MDTKNSFFFASIFLLLIFLSPLSAHAANEFHLIACATKYNFIGPPPAEGIAPMTALCNICDLFKLLQASFTFIWIYLSIPIAAVMMLYGGFLMLLSSFQGESSSQVSRGRKVLFNAVIGLAIVFLAWIGVDSILKIVGARYGTDIQQLGPWNQIKCTAPTAPIPGLPPPPPPPPGTPPPSPPLPPGNILTEKAARDFLTANGITVNHSPCPSGSNGQGCTNLSGVRQATLDAVIATKNACGSNCAFTVSGGTEPGHSTRGTCRHDNGCKIDIRMTNPLHNFVSKNYPHDTPFLRPGDLAECYVAPNRSQWCDEGDHFDISSAR